MHEILKTLQADGRATAEQVAVLTGIDVTEVAARIAEWEASGVIRRYKAVVDLDRLGRNRDTEAVSALIDISVLPARGVGFGDVAARIAMFPEVRSMYLVSGAQDLRCVVVGSSMHDVADFVAQKLSTIDRVTATATHFVLKTYKDDGELFIDVEPDQRLRISP